jgi:hypothetical protein
MNKYFRWYNSIIEFRKQNTPEGYSEKHHIIPRCIGGSDDSDNLVRLTAREHYICHLLLTKMYSDNKLKYAFVSMVNLNNDRQQRTYKISSRLFEYSKKLNSISTSNRCKGKQKHNVGKSFYHDPVTGKSILSFPSEVPEGYLKGRSESSRSKMKDVLKGRVYYHNTETKEVRNFREGDIITEGFVKGNPNAKTNLGKGGRKSFFNTITKKVDRIFPSEKRDEHIVYKDVWVNDGVSEFRIKSFEEFGNFNIGRIKKGNQ